MGKKNFLSDPLDGYEVTLMDLRSNELYIARKWSQSTRGVEGSPQPWSTRVSDALG